jgi:hypothetical protein
VAKKSVEKSDKPSKKLHPVTRIILKNHGANPDELERLGMAAEEFSRDLAKQFFEEYFYSDEENPPPDEENADIRLSCEAKQICNELWDALDNLINKDAK